MAFGVRNLMIQVLPLAAELGGKADCCTCCTVVYTPDTHSPDCKNTGNSFKTKATDLTEMKAQLKIALAEREMHERIAL
jgi:hypothetical protein